MMTHIVKPSKPWLANLIHHDIIRIKAFPPAKLSDINQLLSDHLCLLSRVAAITNDDLTDILAAWRGWSEVFGWAAFLTHLLNRIIGKTAHILIPQDVRNLFQSVGYLMPLIVIPGVNSTEAILDVVIDLVDGDLRGTTAAIGLAEFSLVVICTCPDEWEKHFGRVCEYAVKDDCSLFHEYPKGTNDLCFFRNGLNVSVNGRTRSFKGQIGEVEILSRKISFALISVHDEVRYSRLYELLDRPMECISPLRKWIMRAHHHSLIDELNEAMIERKMIVQLDHIISLHSVS
jgi:hypothetical protein